MYRVERLPTLFVATALVWLLAGCSGFKAIEYRDIKDWQVKPESLSHSWLSAHLVVYNPNRFQVKVKKIDASVMVGGNDWGRFQLDSVFSLPAQSAFTLPVRLKVGNGKLLSSTLSLAAGKQVPYQLKGRIRGGRKNITAEVPFEHSGYFSEDDLKR